MLIPLIIQSRAEEVEIRADLIQQVIERAWSPEGGKRPKTTRSLKDLEQEIEIPRNTIYRMITGELREAPAGRWALLARALGIDATIIDALILLDELPTWIRKQASAPATADQASREWRYEQRILVATDAASQRVIIHDLSGEGGISLSAALRFVRQLCKASADTLTPAWLGEVLHTVGRAAQRCGQRTLARRAYALAVQLQPDASWMLNASVNLYGLDIAEGDIHRGVGGLNQIIQFYEDVLALHPGIHAHAALTLVQTRLLTETRWISSAAERQTLLEQLVPASWARPTSPANPAEDERRAAYALRAEAITLFIRACTDPDVSLNFPRAPAAMLPSLRHRVDCMSTYLGALALLLRGDYNGGMALMQQARREANKDVSLNDLRERIDRFLTRPPSEVTMSHSNPARLLTLWKALALVLGMFGAMGLLAPEARADDVCLSRQVVSR